MIRAIAAFVAVTHLAACSTLGAPSQGEGNPVIPVNVGDRIYTATDTTSMLVTRVSDEEACGEEKCVRRSDVASVQREEVDGMRVIKVIAAAVLLVGLIALTSGASSAAYGFPAALLH